VHEEIKDRRQTCAGRRAIVSFTGSNGTPPVQLNPNLMLSFSFGPAVNGIDESPRLEVVAWDGANGVFNYYLLDKTRPQGAQVPSDDTLSWKLAATSSDVGKLSAPQLAQSCLACHTSGVPIMKELTFPWNNWHSPRSEINYLTRTAPAPVRWPVTADSHFDNLLKADSLESTVDPTIQRFNNDQFDRTIRADGQGGLVVERAKQALRPLFDTTEINLVSDEVESNLHPQQLSGTAPTQPSRPVTIPNGFFIASPSTLDKIFDQIGNAQDTKFDFVVAPEKYKELVASRGLKIQPDNGPALAGDALFAWFTPVLGFAAVHWIDKLVDEQVVSKPFAAAVLGARLKEPIFSAARASLLEFVPERFTAKPGEGHPDALTRAVIAALEAKNPPPGSVAADFLATLKNPDPVAAVRSRVIAYRQDVAQQLGSDGGAELFDLLVKRRQELKNHPVFCGLVESAALLPLPTPGSGCR
jgi:hypothetical protein